MKKLLSIVVPCFNEEEAIPLFIKETNKIEDKLSNDLEFEYIFVNDGSSDNTLQVMRDFASTDKKYRYISFSRNFGKEGALYAGLENAKGDFVTVMDVDLQDPPKLLIEMWDKIQNSDVDTVIAKRTSRDKEPILRSVFSRMFYWIMNKISDTEMEQGTRDFRLMTRQVVDAILSLEETSRFSKGIFSWVGFNVEYISYKNVERQAGETTWSFWQLLKYSFEGIINFSDTPLSIASFLGILSTVISLIFIFIIVLKTLIFGEPTSGWPSTISIILFLGGVQLLTIGIIGKYISKIFNEIKKRPVYIVKETEKSLKK